nr:MAG TPA: hypothetical protein [Caudoviricetes sp.]
MILIKVTIAVWMIFILASGRAIWLYIRNQKKGMNRDLSYYVLENKPSALSAFVCIVVAPVLTIASAIWLLVRG